MLSPEENVMLTRVGPNTPMGDLMRRYWQPIAPLGQLIEREVMPIKLLGENLVLFRDKSGRIGLVAERCAHRKVKLECGHPVNEGIRCAYHGWTYDPSGQCVVTPGEPAGSTLKDKISINAYPVQELAGLVFAYLGPKSETPPLLPRWDRLVWDNVYRVCGFAMIPCNWLQCMENSFDSVHTEWLHGNSFKYWLEKQKTPQTDRRWRLAEGFRTHFLRHEYEIGEFGIDKRAMLEGQTEDDDLWATKRPVVFPNLHLTSGGGRHTFGWRVPLDDTHTMEVFVRVFDPGSGVNVPRQEVVPWIEVPVVDANGQFSALGTVLGQDVMAWVSQGDITDRSDEKLGDTDRGVILFRKLLKEQINRVESGQDPINVFRDVATNRCVDLASIKDRGFAWGYAKDGSYTRGSATVADRLPEAVINEIEDLFVQAAANRSKRAQAVG